MHGTRNQIRYTTSYNKSLYIDMAFPNPHHLCSCVEVECLPGAKALITRKDGAHSGVSRGVLRVLEHPPQAPEECNYNSYYCGSLEPVTLIRIVEVCWEEHFAAFRRGPAQATTVADFTHTTLNHIQKLYAAMYQRLIFQPT